MNDGPGQDSLGLGSGAPAAELWADLSWESLVSHLMGRPALGAAQLDQVLRRSRRGRVVTEAPPAPCPEP